MAGARPDALQEAQMDALGVRGTSTEIFRDIHPASRRTAVNPTEKQKQPAVT